MAVCHWDIKSFIPHRLLTSAIVNFGLVLEGLHAIRLFHLKCDEGVHLAKHLGVNSEFGPVHGNAQHT